jgi:hypothetical protein
MLLRAEPSQALVGLLGKPKAKPLWREATALYIEDRLQHGAATACDPGLSCGPSVQTVPRERLLGPSKSRLCSMSSVLFTGGCVLEQHTLDVLQLLTAGKLGGPLYLRASQGRFPKKPALLLIVARRDISP